MSNEHEEGTLLGTFSYDQDGEPIQTFKLPVRYEPRVTLLSHANTIFILLLTTRVSVWPVELVEPRIGSSLGSY